MRRLFHISLLLCSVGLLRGQMDATPQQSIARYGTPERDELSRQTLLYFRSHGACYICHYFNGRCDVISIFSGTSEAGVPEGLDEGRITQLLDSEVSGAFWKPDRYTINRRWNSSDGKYLAIYDTMRHKLVVMSKSAYARENKATKP